MKKETAAINNKLINQLANRLYEGKELTENEVDHIWAELIPECQKMAGLLFDKRSMGFVQMFEKDDCVQEAVTALWVKFSEFNPEKAEFTTWANMKIKQYYYDKARAFCSKDSEVDLSIEQNDKKRKYSLKKRDIQNTTSIFYVDESGEEKNILDQIASERSAEEAFFGEQFGKQVTEIINRLPDNYRTVLCMKAAGKTTDEIAKQLGCSKDNVHNLLHRARKQVDAELKKAEYYLER